MVIYLANLPFDIEPRVTYSLSIALLTDHLLMFLYPNVRKLKAIHTYRQNIPT